MLKKQIFIHIFILNIFFCAAQTAPRRTFSCTDKISMMAILPLGSYLATAHNQTIDVFHIRTNLKLRSFTMHNAAITALTTHPTENICLSADKNGQIFAWNINDLTVKMQFKPLPIAPIALVSSADGTCFYALASDKITWYHFSWNEEKVENTIIAPTITNIVAKKSYGNLFFKATDTFMSTINCEEEASPSHFKKHKNAIINIKMAGTNVYSGEAKKIKLWNSKLEEKKVFSLKNTITDFDISPKENYLAIGTKTGEIKILTTENQQTAYQFVEKSAIQEVVFHPTETLLLARYEDGTVKSWFLDKN